MQLQSSSYNKQHSPSFGYNYETHKLITKTALKHAPKFKQAVEKALQNKEFAREIAQHPSVMETLQTLSQNPTELKKQLNNLALNNGGLQKLIEKNTQASTPAEKFINEILDGTMLPDLLKKETGFMTNSHFYFLPEGSLKTESFGKEVKTNNALVSYLNHLTKADDAMNTGVFPQESGMALHYLQDMTVPMHTQRANIPIFKHFPFLGKIVDFFLHKNFETGKKLGILSKQEELARNYKPDFDKLRESLPDGFSSKDLFMSNVEFSSQPQLQVERSNKKDWPKIQQEIFNRAVDSTVLALEKIAEKL